MALLTDINDLLKKRKVESDRIEFKKGWNPTAIYRSICAFANDIEDIGGGYILVGVEAIDKIIRYNDSYGAVDFTKDFTKDFIK